MSPVEQEFIQLTERHNKALEYEKTKLLSDTPEGREWSEKTFKKIISRMSELWNQMTDDEKQRHMNLFE